jgi:predicted permease
MSNVKLAFRMLVKTPFISAVAIGSLALGIGANAAIFSLFNQLLLRPLPVPEPGRLVNLAAPGPKPGSQSCNTAGACDDVFSYPMFRDLERVQTVLTGLAAHRLIATNLSYEGHTLNADGMLVSGSYFSVLGLEPALGRLIGPADDPAPGESHVVVLTHAYWQTRFAADPAVVGRTMIVNGQQMTIVGVGPRGFDGTTVGVEPKVFLPITLRALLQPAWKGFEDRRSYSFYLFGRLKPAVSIEQARASLAVPYHAIVNDVEASLQRGMSPQTLERFRNKPLVLEPGGRGQSVIPTRAGPSMKMLLGVTAFVLLIACANIANLLLARSAARAGEMAVRLSIGASRRQIVTQLLVESCVLAVAGGAVGLFVAQWTLGFMASMLPVFATAGFVWHVDRTALAFAAAVTLGTGLLFGLFPAMQACRPDLVTALKGQAGQPSGARSASRFRTTLAIVQVALSMALLVAAGLFTKSLMNISRVDLGLDASHLLTFSVSPGLNGYDADRTKQFFERLEDNLAALPRADGATDSLVPLLAGDNWGNDVTVEGFEAGPDTDTNVRYNEIGAGYFRTLGVPILAGREFTRADAKDRPKVAIVNEAFTRKFNLGRNPIGKHMGNRGGPLETEIVGLVQDAKYSDVKDTIPPLFFRPYLQGGSIAFGSLAFFVRSRLDAEHLLPDVAKAVATLDRDLPVVNLRTMAEQVRQNVFLDRMIGVLSASFAALATLLAAIGLYGVLAYTVSQRTREIGVRMALGASPERVRGMVLRQVGLMTAVGGAMGLGAAIGIGRLAQSLLYKLNGYDPIVLVTAAATLTLVALGAGGVPAYRASHIDPMRALRHE